MNNAEVSQVFLSLAEDLFNHRITERDVAKLVAELPPVTNSLLKELGDKAENFVIRWPRHGWTIAKVAYIASIAQGQDLYVKSMAGWYLGRAANHWGQPTYVKSIISQARRGFLKLNEMGWVAACDWQFYLLSWARPDVPQAVSTLQNALEGLQQAGFVEFVPQCRAALAYAQLLIGEFSHAQENIRICENDFIVADDPINRARCWLNEASSYRRQGQVIESLKKLEDALAIFEEADAPVEMAKAHYQIGLCRLMIVDDLPKAVNHFHKASELFFMHDMDLWQATCINNLGYVYSLLGSLEKADQCYQQARKSFIHHKVTGPLADNLNDSGKLNTQRGHITLSIEQFKEAERLHDRLGMKLSAAVDTANLGEAYRLVGRYQDALYHLERAAERFRTLNNLQRLESSEKFIALIWSQLGRYEEALDHLDKAADYHKRGADKLAACSIYNYRAEILFKRQEHAKAIENLTLSLEAAIRTELHPQAALAKRLLGEALSHIRQDDQALAYLQESYSDFTNMGMVVEQAFTLIALGTHHTQASQIDEATAAFEYALQLSDGSLPEIEWQAYAGLAHLASIRGDVETEILSYRRATLALTKIRQNFWQPALAGSYLQAPSVLFTKAVQRAVETGSHQDVLQFVEQHKAVTLAEQLKTSDVLTKSQKTRELAELKTEITWLHNKSRVSFESSNRLKSELQSRQWHSQLVEKIRLYDSKVAQLERQSYSRKKRFLPWNNFDLIQFRNIANEALGKSWAALDFYLTDTSLITLTITPDQYLIQSSAITDRISMALQMLSLGRQHAGLHQSDLRVLGDFLIPQSVAKSLTPDTYLLLIPHKNLHAVPWAAIQPGNTPKPLVNSCIPLIAPSLYIFSLLWKRMAPGHLQTKHDNGLVIGLSTFKGLRSELPHVKEEVAKLAARLGSQGKFLLESEATWSNLIKCLKSGNRNDRGTIRADFNWLHIASHIFIDSYTGRTSGIVLWDGDVWLDQLRNLPPLPKLLTFSACNGVFSFVFEGDEHMDLPSICFIAGANSIVGSTRRILDSSASDFTISFYEHYLNGLRPAQAVAQVQREMIQQGKDIESWASYVCMGVP